MLSTFNTMYVFGNYFVTINDNPLYWDENQEEDKGWADCGPKIYIRLDQAIKVANYMKTKFPNAKIDIKTLLISSTSLAFEIL